MNEILIEIKEILKRSPARFLKIYFRADISSISDSVIKVDIVSTLDFFGNSVIKTYENHFENNERLMEKWHATGIAIGTLEYYLTDKKLSYSKEIFIDDNDEINARILINV